MRTFSATVARNGPPNEARSEDARQRAAARLAEKLSDEEIASVNAALVRSLAQLQVKRRRHR
jgi:F0F1-type ATP synthase epsilon subunit